MDKQADHVADVIHKAMQCDEDAVTARATEALINAGVPGPLQGPDHLSGSRGSTDVPVAESAAKR